MSTGRRVPSRVLSRLSDGSLSTAYGMAGSTAGERARSNRTWKYTEKLSFLRSLSEIHCNQPTVSTR